MSVIRLVRKTNPRNTLRASFARLATKDHLSAMDVTNLNVFVWCKWLRHLGRLMMLCIVGSMIALVAYSTLEAALVPGVQSDSPGLQALYIILTIVFCAVVSMVVWTYMATMLADPGGVPPGWHPFSAAELSVDALEAGGAPPAFLLDPPAAERLAQLCQDPSFTSVNPVGSEEEAARAIMERPRWCKKCRSWKAPRAHHCSVTRRCVLKMDHYCVWVATTVGLLNYKQFVLFLCWGFVGCLMSAALLLKPCIALFSTGDPDLRPMLTSFLALVFTAAFVLALAGFVIMHLRLIAINQTTIEAYEKKPLKPWPYDRGSAAANFADVFGEKRWQWCLPIVGHDHRRRLLSQNLDVEVPLPQGWGAEVDRSATPHHRDTSGSLEIESSLELLERTL